MTQNLQWGPTAPRLLDPPTADDYKRTDDLQQFLRESYQCEDSTDSAKRQRIIGDLQELAKRCVKDIVSEKGESTAALAIQVLTFGSYKFGVHIPSDDLEIVCFGPSLVNCQEFFKALHGLLIADGVLAEVESLQKEKDFYGSSRKKEEHPALEALQKEKAIAFKHSPADFMKFKLQGISVVLSYAIISGVPLETLNILSDGLICYLDEASLPGLEPCRAAAVICTLVPNTKNFQMVLRYVNFWARKKGLYSNVTGYLGAVSLAILVARICQVYPQAIPSVLLMKFFHIYSQWDWPSPVMLSEITKIGDLNIGVWDAPNNADDFSHIMPIISPAYPAWNVSACVSQSTLRVIQEQFICANDICEDIRVGKANWSKLCEGLEFFKIYNLYIQLDIRAKDASGLRLWKLEVEPLWRRFIFEIEAQGNQTTKCHLCPTEYAYDDTEHHCALFIGIKRIKSKVSGLTVTVPYPIDSKITDGFKNEITRRKKPGLDLAFSQFRREKMPDSVRQLVSAPSGV